jgi:hypothetical protein
MLNSQLPLIAEATIAAGTETQGGGAIKRRTVASLRSTGSSAKPFAPRLRLDDRTRQLGLDGVAAARAILFEAARLRDEPASLAA